MTPRLLQLLYRARRAVIQREDSRVATQLAMTANVNRDPKKRKRPYKMEDFLPKTPKTSVQLLAKVEAMNAFFGGKDLRPVIGQ